MTNSTLPTNSLSSRSKCKTEKGITCSFVIFLWQRQCARRLGAFAGCHSPSMICLELFNCTLNHILIFQVSAPFSKSCTDHKLCSIAIGNKYGEGRTQCANNYYHVRQRYEVIAHSLCCLLPTNGMPWEPQQGPIRFEGHKQVAEFSFMAVWWMITRLPTRKQWSSFISSPFCAETSNTRVISSTTLLRMPPSLDYQMRRF